VLQSNLVDPEDPHYHVARLFPGVLEDLSTLEVLEVQHHLQVQSTLEVLEPQLVLEVLEVQHHLYLL
jgi:hypothetical protein